MTSTTKTIDAETLAIIMKDRGLDTVDTTRAGELGASAARKGWAITENPYGAETEAELHGAWAAAFRKTRQDWKQNGGKEADEAYDRLMDERAAQIWKENTPERVRKALATKARNRAAA